MCNVIFLSSHLRRQALRTSCVHAGVHLHESLAQAIVAGKKIMMHTLFIVSCATGQCFNRCGHSTLHTMCSTASTILLVKKYLALYNATISNVLEQRKLRHERKAPRIAPPPATTKPFLLSHGEACSVLYGNKCLSNRNPVLYKVHTVAIKACCTPPSAKLLEQ